MKKKVFDSIKNERTVIVLKSFYTREYLDNLFETAQREINMVES